jgi:hypothetical protein
MTFRQGNQPVQTFATNSADQSSSEPTRSRLKTPCASVRRVLVHHSYGVCTCVSVSMLTRVALIVPLIGAPAGVLPSGINCVISKVPV